MASRVKNKAGYAYGESGSRPPHAPKECVVCGERVLVSDGVWYVRDPYRPEGSSVSVHHGCSPEYHCRPMGKPYRMTVDPFAGLESIAVSPNCADYPLTHPQVELETSPLQEERLFDPDEIDDGLPDQP